MMWHNLYIKLQLNRELFLLLQTDSPWDTSKYIITWNPQDSQQIKQDSHVLLLSGLQLEPEELFSQFPYLEVKPLPMLLCTNSSNTPRTQESHFRAISPIEFFSGSSWSDRSNLDSISSYGFFNGSLLSKKSMALLSYF